MLRRLAFLGHAAGTATFPGLVLRRRRGGSRRSSPRSVAAGVFAALLALLLRTRRVDSGAATGVLLVGALALGIGARQRRLRDRRRRRRAAARLAARGRRRRPRDHRRRGGRDPRCSTPPCAAPGRRGTFEPETSQPAADVALVAAIALAAVVAVDAVGALLAGVVLVVPAATARLITDDLRELRAAATLLALAEGTAGLWLSPRASTSAPARCSRSSGGPCSPRPPSTPPRGGRRWRHERARRRPRSQRRLPPRRRRHPRRRLQRPARPARRGARPQRRWQDDAVPRAARRAAVAPRRGPDRRRGGVRPADRGRAAGLPGAAHSTSC